MTRVAKHPRSVLVTGAAGFIGSHLCNHLGRGGYRVIALDMPGISWWRLDALQVVCQRVHLNLLDRAGVAALIEDHQPIDCVYHLAAHTDVVRSVELLDDMIAANIMGTQNFLHACRNKVGRCVVIGTCEEYGDGDVPFSEQQRERAVSPYSWSKICTTHLAQLYARLFDLPVVVARPFLTYGPLQLSAMLVPAAIRAALTGADFPMTPGEQTRDFNYVNDIVAGLIAVGEAPDVEGDIFNLATGSEMHVRDVVSLIYGLCHSSRVPEIGTLPYRRGETMRFYGNATAAHKQLHWHAQTALEEGLTHTIAWYRRYLQQGEHAP